MTAWWCTRGGLVTVVEADSIEAARTKAARAFWYGGWSRRVAHPGEVTAREADGTDLALWAHLLNQRAGGVEGARVAEMGPAPEVTELDLFGSGS